jgi:hypothetical protein
MEMKKVKRDEKKSYEYLGESTFCVNENFYFGSPLREATKKKLMRFRAEER